MQTATASHTATGDMSNVQALTAEALAVELAAAKATMSGSRHNRAGLVYTDAKTAVAVLSAEVARRETAAQDDSEYDDRHAVEVDFVELFKVQAGQHAAIREALAPAGLRVETNPNRQCGIECTGAKGAEICTCECGGRNHGLLHRAGRISTPESQARAWARMPVVTDDEPF